MEFNSRVSDHGKSCLILCLPQHAPIFFSRCGIECVCLYVKFVLYLDFIKRKKMFIINLFAFCLIFFS